MPEKIDPKYLEGLKHQYSECREVVEDGRKVTKYAQKERDMKPEDVLAWKDKGAEVVLVTGDGRKIRISKDRPAREQEKSKKEK